MSNKKVLAGGAIGLAALSPVALLVILGVLAVALLGAVVSATSGGLGAMFADENVQSDYGYFGCGPGGDDSGGSVIPATATQTEYVRSMVGTAKTMGVSEQGQVVATMVMLQESSIQSYANGGGNTYGYDIGGGTGKSTQFWLDLATLSMNYAHDAVGNDADSVGLFQQRASAGWADDASFQAANNPDAAIRRLMDPRWSVQAFFGGPGGPANRGLLDISGWEGMPPTVAAQTVQGSAFPDAYAKWENQARALVTSNQDAPPVPLVGDGGGGGGGNEGGTPPPISICETGGGIIGGEGSSNAMIQFGQQWLGTPYAWGGGSFTGPSLGHGIGAGITGFDCSGLTRYMVYNGSGQSITMPRTAQEQYAATSGNTVAWEDMQPGDLMFWGTAGNIYHVAMYAGNGQMIEAPVQGDVVKMAPIRDSNFFAATRLNVSGNEPAPEAAAQQSTFFTGTPLSAPALAALLEGRVLQDG